MPRYILRVRDFLHTYTHFNTKIKIRKDSETLFEGYVNELYSNSIQETINYYFVSDVDADNGYVVLSCIE